MTETSAVSRRDGGAGDGGPRVRSRQPWSGSVGPVRGRDSVGRRDGWLLAKYRRDGDDTARTRLLENFAPLVHRVAAVYSAPGHEEDLR